VTAAADRVRRAVERALPVAYGGVIRWSGPTGGEWSWMFAALTGGQAPAALLVKVPRWDQAPDLPAALAAGPQRDTEEEFRALEAIAAVVAGAGDPGLTAVVPVAYVAEVNAIVTERLNARPIRRRLGRGRGDAAALFGRVGRWLRVFHASGSPTTGTFPATAEEAAFTDIAGRAGRGDLGDAAAALAAAARRREGRAVATGVLHGDLSLGNVLVTIDDRVAVIDPNRYPGRLAVDPAHLLTEARLGRRQLAGAGLTRRAGVVERWTDALLEGYPGLDPDLVAYERAAATVRRWASLEEAVRGPARMAMVPGRVLLRSEAAARLESL